MAKISITAAVTFLALATLNVNAQAANPVCNKDLKAVTQGDLDRLQGCQSYTGTISIESSGEQELKLSGVQEINGNLLLTSNTALRSFDAPQLSKVSGELRFVSQTVLGKLSLPNLVEVTTLNLQVLPALERIEFPAGLKRVQDAHIEDTRAPSVTGFQPERMHSFTLSSNNYMKQFDFSTVKEVQGALSVFTNGNSLEFKGDELTSVQTGDFRNVGKLSLPKLSRVNGDITFNDNYFGDLSLDQLQSVKGTLTMANNNLLQQTSFKQLMKVGGAFSIGNNTQLTKVEGFPTLQEVDGTVDVAGSFDSYAFPVLQDVRGGMRLQTTSNQLQCSEIEKKLKAEHVVKGDTWSCSSNMQASDMVPTLGQNGSGSGKSINGNGGNNGMNGGTSDAGMLIPGSMALVLTGVTAYFGF
ncbi:hypothetical protein BJ944DRAFT_240709 [Cunninghamella echinulata]|nr:hypothetical protein BJ944DRAFT_240709 [Cunninghamella echinulata]